MSLADKITLVTGAAAGIGRAIALKLVADGGRVVAMDTDEAGLAALAEGSGDAGRILTITGDVANETDVAGAVRKSVERFGRIDNVVCNAGIMERVAVEDLPYEDWHRVLDVNLSQSFLFAKHAGAELRGNNGAMLIVTSTRAFMSEAETESYSATKGGLFALTHSLAVSLAPDVRVNAVAPGWINVSGEELRPVDHAQHLVGRVGEPRDIAEAASFLLDGEKAGFITGQTLIVDGGMTRKMIYEH
ncbi:SDR family oxidoreductase [Jiella sp. MQZ9-1]|uniref:SDR family oxidoreductase n=1 Tax=Jiella flava TaxID=2816857 RepID=A0A939FVD8_9HYPH|nr:SDR family oxidoreductase [Jiella flava]MBO0662202.1 SDR family oxidoreductase [Jiella flava]MCD2470968.1 SDR family oxidoreductase [Jiella flava]